MTYSSMRPKQRQYRSLEKGAQNFGENSPITGVKGWSLRRKPLCGWGFGYHQTWKARKAEPRIRMLCRRQGLAPGPVRRIQVQAVALYGAELWWHGQKTGNRWSISKPGESLVLSAPWWTTFFEGGGQRAWSLQRVKTVRITKNAPNTRIYSRSRSGTSGTG